ncbi:MAG: molybdate ABC transporter ATP-binding protein ModF [Pseudomonadales bacterium]|nr:molybdate ABC transporter ATP-binding protein ModF [Pseudomonadales bacterium]MBO6565529.1 molybdate ABC transporter ATP-binding protein ModF [Pseudomonadales bacterium]MBO6597820.1 molybdate ABC transporter ATP-binding protein ModF [Pseudomonadales bacterium]MBO6702358.1 molybdate ABC transporter ATP-binding protein ModF [Pseudomonadales bacterium]MBO6824228.1 molybdate ABC transporter ATP-binding protein ModF [Pseudomonadales bacterium]
MITFRHAEIKLSETFSLSQISWQINDGQCWAITGPNGSGKSALVAALAGEGELRSGQRDLGEANVAVVSLEEQSRLIARERQRDDSDLTDEINEGTPVQEMLDETCQDFELQKRLIDDLGLQPLLERGFRKLSTGETRKVLLTRALTSKPQVLVLDEPFEGLDVATVPRVAALLEDIAGSTTLIMSLNRLDEMPDCTTHAMRLESGAMSQQFECSDGGQAARLLGQISQIRSDIQLPPPETDIEVPLNADGTLVALNKARVAYTDNLVFENLDWHIKPGDHWQVKGPNGSGKTCLLNLITGDHPQCYVNDISLFGFKRGQGESIWQIKQYLGFVSTGLHWDYRLSVSVRNVIVSGFHDSIGLYQKATDKEKALADAWLELLGLSDRATDSFSSLSYGEQRVVLIARAMVKHPPVLLLDEPCLGLDEANRQLVLSLTDRICEEGATTLIYVTHHDEDKIHAIGNVLDLGNR